MWNTIEIIIYNHITSEFTKLHPIESTESVTIYKNWPMHILMIFPVKKVPFISEYHTDCFLPCGPMNPEAGLGMWIPSDWGEGAGTKALDPGEGTWSCGLPGDPTLSRVPGEGVPISAVEGEGVTWNSHQNITSSKFHWKNSTMYFFYFSNFMHFNSTYVFQVDMHVLHLVNFFKYHGRHTWTY